MHKTHVIETPMQYARSSTNKDSNKTDPKKMQQIQLSLEIGWAWKSLPTIQGEVGDSVGYLADDKGIPSQHSFCPYT